MTEYYPQDAWQGESLEDPDYPGHEHIRFTCPECGVPAGVSSYDDGALRLYCPDCGIATWWEPI